MLDRKLEWLDEYAEFQVNINSVLGTSVRHPEDAVLIARRARELGLLTTVGIIHDGTGQLQPLSKRDRHVYHQLLSISTKSFSTFAYYNQFQKNLGRGLPNEWHCRAGSRFLYICENGLVHYCSQQRGFPGIPLEQYTAGHVEREYHTVKPCAPYCTISCVNQVSMIDEFRDDPLTVLGHIFPAKQDQTAPFNLPIAVHVLTWLFLPRFADSKRTLVTSVFSRAVLWCLRAK